MPPTATLDHAFGALADGTRRTICEVLRRDGEQTVGELVSRFDVSQPAVSRHLRVLREAGLVRAETRGRTRRYRLRPDALAPAQAWMVLNGFWSDRFDALDAALTARAPSDDTAGPGLPPDPASTRSRP